MSNLKVVRIDVVGNVQAAQLNSDFGDKVVRFTYNDNSNTYAALGAFPNEEVMIRDATGNGFISRLLESTRGSFNDDPIIKEAEALNNWSPLWVDKTLRAV